MQMDRQKDMTQLILTFRNFASVPKNILFSLLRINSLIFLIEDVFCEV